MRYDGFVSPSSSEPVTAHPFQPTRTLHAQVLDHLGLEIVSGKLDVGHQLPPEDALAAELGISKGGLREVIKALASKGMISVRPRTGTVVNPRHEWVLFDPQVLDWHTSLRGAPLAAQLLQLRLFVEPQASRLACTQATDAEIGKVAQAYERMDQSFSEGASGLDDFLAADLEFHQALLNASGNELIGQLGRLFAGVLRNGFDMTFHVDGSVERSLPLHKEISDAIVDRDPERAERASLNLLITTSEELKNAEEAAS
ncbi:FCD domain-containing protein [soil metagenome]